MSQCGSTQIITMSAIANMPTGSLSRQVRRRIWFKAVFDQTNSEFEIPVSKKRPAPTGAPQQYTIRRHLRRKIARLRAKIWKWK